MMTARSEGGRTMTSLGNIDLISEHAIDEVCLRVSTLKEEFPDRWIAASIMGKNRTQWQRLARQLVSAGADAIECSFSCPQGSLGSRPGALLGQDPTLVRTVTRWVKDAAGEEPIIIKLTPHVADLAEIAEAGAEGGGDSICAAISIPGLRPSPSSATAASSPGVTPWS
jgi:dihydroorotate dehydrogenase